MNRKKLLIGTNNPAKRRYFQENCLKNSPIELVSPRDIGCNLNIEETAGNAADIALQKARAWHQATGLPVISQDSGMILLDLPSEHPDQPGVLVRRASGHEMSDDEMVEWYRDLARRHGGIVRFAWQWAWCFFLGDDEYFIYTPDRALLERNAVYLTDSICETRHDGWPIDSITQVLPGGKYLSEVAYADISSDEENDGCFPQMLKDIERMIK